MSAAPHTRQFIREGVAAYLVAAGIPNLANVYKAAPRQQDEMFTVAGQITAANLYLVIANQSSKRLTMGPAGSGYQRQDEYEFYIRLICQSLQPLSEDAESDNDAIIDALKAAVLADSTLGGAVFMSAEGPGDHYSPDFRVRLLADEPSGDAGTLIMTEIRFTAIDNSTW